jgi:uncharacterized protein YjiS (DUF1127 family)
MTCIAATPQSDLRTSWGAAFAALGAALTASVRVLFVLQERARERAQLAELGPEALKDMGLSPADVDRELRRPLLPW